MPPEPTPDQLRKILKASAGVLDGAPDQRLRCQSMDSHGAPVRLRWGRHESPFGPVLAAAADSGLCWLNFIKGPLAEAQEQMARFWPGAERTEDPAATEEAVALAFQPSRQPAEPLPLLLRGTAFQVAVWRALLRIPRGALVSYGDLAAAVGHAKAVRAAGSAVGANPVSVLVPCHRVIGKTGTPFKYGGGPERKKALLAWELAPQSPSTSAMP